MYDRTVCGEGEVGLETLVSKQMQMHYKITIFDKLSFYNKNDKCIGD